jgi:hypothetical protein
MAFTVTYSDGGVVTYTGHSRYFIRENDVLVVYDDVGKKIHFSPVAWVSVSEDPPHQPSDDVPLPIH